MYFCTWSAGGYDKEDKAARAYDLAALKYWGSSTTINFPVPPLSLCHTEIHILLLQYELMGLWSCVWGSIIINHFSALSWFFDSSPYADKFDTCMGNS
jgi:hypothetical protein